MAVPLEEEGEDTEQDNLKELEFVKLDENEMIDFHQIYEKHANGPDVVKGILLLHRKELRNYMSSEDRPDYEKFLEEEVPWSADYVLDRLIPLNSCKPVPQGVWNILTTNIKDADPQIYDTLHGVGMLDTPKQHLLNFLAHIELIIELSTAEGLWGIISKTHMLQMLSSDFKTAWKADMNKPDRSANDTFELMIDLLRELPYQHEWYWNFMDGLRKNSTGVVIVDEINDQFTEEFDRYNRSRALEERRERQREEQEDDDDEGRQSVPTLQQLKNIDDQIERGLPVEPLVLRLYQEELAEPALRGLEEGYNTLVCSITGSGKTEVAVEVIRKALETSQRSDVCHENKKVLMIVPTQVLVDQQSGRLRKYLRDKYRIVPFAGREPTRVATGILIYQTDIAVMTPQIFVNMLYHFGNEKVEEGVDPFGLKMFSLIVFDECHHCDSNHPYKEIMDQYMDIKWANKGKSGRELGLPTILGLTASLGAGKIDSVESARYSIERKAANLDAIQVAFVHSPQAIQSLQENAQLPTDRLERVTSVKKDTALIIRPLIYFMKKAEDWIAEEFDLAKKNGHDIAKYPVKPDEKAVARRGGAQYLSWVNNLCKQTPEEAVINRRKILLLLEILKHCCNGLYLYAHASLDNTIDHLKAKYYRIRVDDHAPMKIRVDFCHADQDDKIAAEYDKVCDEMGMDSITRVKEPNELLIALRTIIQNLERKIENGGDERALIFVERRVLAYYLADYLDPLSVNHPQWVARVDTAGGQAVDDDDDRFTITHEQFAQRIKMFNAGKCRILVCTNVLGEGFDVKECSLVVKYNHVYNVREFIQHRGRARAKGGECIMITDNSGIAEKEQENIMTEQFLLKAVRNIAEAGRDMMKKKNDEAQRHNFGLRENAKNKENETIKALDKYRFDIICNDCEVVLASTKVMKRHRNHYVICDDTIYDRTILDARPNSINNTNPYSGISIAGLNCNGHQAEGDARKFCQANVGKVLKVEEAYFPVLKAKKVKLREDTDEKTIVPIPQDKWSRAATEIFCTPKLSRREWHKARTDLINRSRKFRCFERDQTEENLLPAQVDPASLLKQLQINEDEQYAKLYRKDEEKMDNKEKERRHDLLTVNGEPDDSGYIESKMGHEDKRYEQEDD